MIGKCPDCGNPLAEGECLICKYGLANTDSESQGATLREPDPRYHLRTTAEAPSKMTVQQKLYFQMEYDKKKRNPSTSLLLTLILGGAGAHRFYLGQWGWGITYVL